MKQPSVVFAAFVALGLVAFVSAQPTAPGHLPLARRDLPENERGLVSGYLAPEDRPDSLALLPPPPAAQSPAFRADEEAFRAAKAKRTPERLALATADANLRFPAALAAFAPSLGISPSEQDTPHLVTLLRRSLTDAGLATYAAKNHYQRVRPFALYEESCCTVEQEPILKKDGSYPSGHAAIGWAWALILTELAPERANLLLQRGHDFGVSRMICGVHWQSDVEAGRLVGAAVVARLHADPVFLAQLIEAKREIEAARPKRAGSPPDLPSK